MKGILAVLKEKSIHATVITPIAFDTRERPELEESAKALAALMADLASIASSAGALYADSHTPSRDRLAAGGDDLSWGDGIHPGPRGKRAMADALQEAWKLGKPLSAWPQ